MDSPNTTQAIRRRMVSNNCTLSMIECIMIEHCYRNQIDLFSV